MANILEKIVADKRVELVALEQALPLASFKDSLTPSVKSFYDALANSPTGFIFECKKASPSKGLIREPFDLDEILQAYLSEAACLSVLTDYKYFQGSYDYLEYVTSRVDIPVLNKDFFVNEYQVYRARYHHADAILLMLSVLSDEEYSRLHTLADSLQLDVLTEVSNQHEAQRAVTLGARIIGINNRDLRDLSTDLATTEVLVPYLRELGHEGLIISESGIYTRAQINRLAPYADGYLVGSSLMAQTDLQQAVNDLVYGQIKVCGMRDEQQAAMVAASPAHYMGLIFASKSPRYISPDDAENLTKAVPFNYVGVFVDEDIDVLVEVAQRCQLTAVQLHGKEDQEYVNELRANLPACCQIWYAYGIEHALPNSPLTNIDKVLYDCQVGAQSGGTGQQFNWSLLANIDHKDQVILAGGLQVDNILAASRTGAAILDVNSGVENAPADKSSDKLAALFTQLKQYKANINE